MLKIRHAFTLSSQGHRSVQEDHGVVNIERGIFVTADGFGGGDAGIKTAKLACEGILEFLQKEAGDSDATLPFVLKRYYSLPGNIVFNAVLHANRKVLFENRNQSSNQKGGASLLAGFLSDSFLALANVGVCSAWLVRKGKLTQLVKPRSYSSIINPFTIDPVEGADSPMMAVGMVEELEPEIFECQIEPGDWVFLQTDGIDEEIRNKIMELHHSGLEGRGLQDSLKSVVEAASNKDNSLISLMIF